MFDKRHIIPLFSDMACLFAKGVFNSKFRMAIIQTGRDIRHNYFEANDKFRKIPINLLISEINNKNENKQNSDAVIMPDASFVFGNTIGGIVPYYYIGSIVCALKPRTCFEIGTYLGLSALTIAMNAPADAIVYTVDLPEEFDPSDVSTLTSGDRKLAAEARQAVGRALVNHPASCKVRQIRCNSMNLDVSNYLDSIDFAFIDGGHSYELIKNDTEKCLNLLSSNGIIVWDDYNWIFPDVRKYLTDLSREIPLFRISGTQYVVHYPGIR